MPALTIRKSIVIQASPDKVYATVRDFRQWPKWSPWVLCEPECALTFREDGKGYSWDGAVIGSGSIEVVSEDAPRLIRKKLIFLKPFKSSSKAGFEFKELGAGQGVEVTWTMDGSLPFFLFFLKAMMTNMLGMDYERGLAMLKDLVETGSVPSKLAFPGRKAFPGGRYIGVKAQTPIAQIGESMDRSFAKLQQWLKARGIKRTGVSLAIYHKWDLAKGIGDYTSAVFVGDGVFHGKLPEGFVSGVIPACEAEIVRHTGPYRHLGNAWSAAMARAKGLKWPCDKNIDDFEIYENQPGQVRDNDLVTTIYLPVK